MNDEDYERLITGSSLLTCPTCVGRKPLSYTSTPSLSSSCCSHLLQPGGLLHVDLQLLPEPLVLPHQDVALDHVAWTMCSVAVVRLRGHKPADEQQKTELAQSPGASWMFSPPHPLLLLQV